MITTEKISDLHIVRMLTAVSLAGVEFTHTALPAPTS
jgi:hypothetical protein